MLAEMPFASLRRSMDALEKQTTDANSKELVDATARLRSVIKRLNDLNESWTSKIKGECFNKQKTTLEGEAFKAVYRERTKEVLKTDEVKAVLGKRLPEFMKLVPYTELTFSAKE